MELFLSRMKMWCVLNSNPTLPLFFLYHSRACCSDGGDTPTAMDITISLVIELRIWSRYSAYEIRSFFSSFSLNSASLVILRRFFILSTKSSIFFSDMMIDSSSAVWTKSESSMNMSRTLLL